jgi:hypothetical protein
MHILKRRSLVSGGLSTRLNKLPSQNSTLIFYRGTLQSYRDRSTDLDILLNKMTKDQIASPLYASEGQLYFFNVSLLSDTRLVDLCKSHNLVEDGHICEEHLLPFYAHLVDHIILRLDVIRRTRPLIVRK